MRRNKKKIPEAAKLSLWGKEGGRRALNCVARIDRQIAAKEEGRREERTLLVRIEREKRKKGAGKRALTHDEPQRKTLVRRKEITESSPTEGPKKKVTMRRTGKPSKTNNFFLAPRLITKFFSFLVAIQAKEGIFRSSQQIVEIDLFTTNLNFSSFFSLFFRFL